MKKTIIILSLFVFIASSCGNKKTPFDLTTLPSEWKMLSKVNGKLVAGNNLSDVLKIEGNKIFFHYFSLRDQIDEPEYEILESYQTGDTVVITVKPTDGQEWTSDFKFRWLNKDKGLAEWIFGEGEGNTLTFVVNEKAVEFSNIKSFDDKQSQRKVKHYYEDNVYGVVFFDDGTAFSERYGVKGNFENLEPNAVYKEFPVHLQIEETKFDLFDDWGHIDQGWKIINHYRIYSLFQITNFEPETAKIPAKDIQKIKETCLIFTTPNNENGYEEWAWYVDDRTKEFAAMNIQAVDAQKRYLSFTLYDNEEIIIDTKKKQNGTIYSALLYRKGYIPIMISISGESEEGMEQIETYLSESGDGYPPFEHWNTLKEE